MLIYFVCSHVASPQGDPGQPGNHGYPGLPGPDGKPVSTKNLVIYCKCKTSRRKNTEH